jgi:hypothetical protein
MNILWAIGKNRWAALFIGLAQIPLGLFYANSQDGEITCGGQVMQEGDICETTRRGSTREQSLDEMKQGNITAGYVISGVGGVLVLVGVTQFVLRARRRSAEAEPTSTETPTAA